MSKVNTKQSLTNHHLVGQVKWAKVLQPAPKYQPKGTSENPGKEYSVDLILTEQTEKELLEIFAQRNVPLESRMGSKIKTNKDGERYITFRRDAVNSRGEPVDLPVKVLSSKGTREDFKTELPGVQIGNGTTVALHFFIYDNQFGEGSVRLKGLQVMKLVEYSSGSDSFEMLEEGQTLEEMQSTIGGDLSNLNDHEAVF